MDVRGLKASYSGLEILTCYNDDLIEYIVMDYLPIYLIFSMSCFLIAIVFFRKGNIPIGKVLLPFMMSLYSPYKMKEHLIKEGIYLILLGYLSFIVYIVLFFDFFS